MAPNDQQAIARAPLAAPSAIHDTIAADARELSAKLHAHRTKLFPPKARKNLRRFTSGEVAKLVGINDGYLRQLSLEGRGPQPDTSPSGRRSYTFEDIQSLRAYLDESGKGARRYRPHRVEGEQLQVIGVVNFKGGSGKTTTAAHLAQHLTLQGYRVLAIDLDPQASLSALHGYQPEFDVEENGTLYGAIRYDDARRELSEIIRQTYFLGLDIVPGNIELMEFEHETPKALAMRQSGDPLFFARVARALATVQDRYDVVVIDCPPQLGFLTLSALCAATAILIPVHPQMLDVMSMCQFLIMTSDLLAVVAKAGGNMNYDWMRYLVTRYEPGDGPQAQMVGFMRSLFGDRMVTNMMLKSTAISDAGITKQTLYEVSRDQFTRATYDRAMESLDSVNGEIQSLIQAAWGRA
ncbi:MULTISPECIES: plasmid partitioning protein RepA [Bradyrhizobium]|nr:MULTISPECIES: plasmid partitioning protein RepA [Bradyrhizobium]MCS3453870.1 chromosome partitioning protein [Bradyrhizobium elkanii]MCS3566844.1 chromosome partitioning protein [Bradyrhizobium elkanii]MCW2153984.1 chromosome partitioning protein [Bradyrhizobium elkanii]MCW2380424.1 chromosome partitioning protein [Bradyrhizobium elkanii]